MASRLHLIIFIFTCTTRCITASDTIPISASPNLSLTITDDNGYNLNINGVPWLLSDSTFFRADGQLYSVEEGTLKLVKMTNSTGIDQIGEWESVDFLYKAGVHQMQTSLIYYTRPIWPLVLFRQTYQDDVQNASSGRRDETISGFPSFQVLDSSNIGLGFMSYGGMMTGNTEKKFGTPRFYEVILTSLANNGRSAKIALETRQDGPVSIAIFTLRPSWRQVFTDFNQGLIDGPLAIFDKNKTATTFVISPASSFMVASMWHKSLFNVQGAAHWGILGTVNDVPEGFEMSTVAYCGDKGINNAFEGWGEFLQTYYGRDDRHVKHDLTINYIGYWTDNGAYYYYNTENGTNYEDTILDISTYISKTGIPFKYLQYDSWWYYKGVNDGVKTWQGRDDVFPHGMQWLHNKTGYPVSAHNKFWAPDTTYASQNGGKYNFIIDKRSAVPDDQSFWNDLLREARSWGLITYEQDWLNHAMTYVEELQTNVTLGETWLKQMGQAAEDNGVTIQYCMSNSRHILQSLAIPTVTQARVSMDYHPGLEQWRIGISSIFAHAVGIRPYKDTFWSTTVEPGNPYIGGTTEPNTELNALIATLSTGPVGPGDMIGGFNSSILMRCINSNGTILKPSKPATAIDNQIRRVSGSRSLKRSYTGDTFRLSSSGKLAFGSSFNGPSGEVYTTYSDFGGNWKFGIILAADLLAGYYIGPFEAGFRNFPTSRIFPRSDPSQIELFTDDVPVLLTGCSTVNYCLYYTSPSVAMGTNRVIVILGELDKWVPMSPQRVVEIEMNKDIVIRITGLPKEYVTFWFTINDQLESVKCMIGTNGFAVILTTSLTCYPD